MSTTCAGLLLHQARVLGAHVAGDCGTYFINNLILGYLFASVTGNGNGMCAAFQRWIQVVAAGLALAQITHEQPQITIDSVCLLLALTLIASFLCRCRLERENLLSTFILRMDLCVWMRYISKQRGQRVWQNCRRMDAISRARRRDRSTNAFGIILLLLWVKWTPTVDNKS